MMAITHITHVTLYVENQQEALAWYQQKLGFEVCMDNNDFGFRWLTICPKGNPTTQFVLMSPNDENEARIGNRAMCILGTNDCQGDCTHLEQVGVEIVDPPSELPWGISAVFKDLYGNPYNLVQAKAG